MATQYGAPCRWGIDSTNLTAGTGVLRWTSQSYTREVEVAENRDRDGEVVGAVAYNTTESLEAELFPSSAAGGSGSLANAASALVNLPVPGNIVAVIDATDTNVGAAGPGGKVWFVRSVRANRSSTGAVTASLTLARWGGIASYTAAT